MMNMEEEQEEELEKNSEWFDVVYGPCLRSS
jgi:hypothetical protein